MGFMFSGLFWGIFLILVGFVVILKVFIPNLSIPFFRIGIAIFFFYIGISILVDGFGVKRIKDDGDIIFQETNIIADENKKEYNILFGKGNIDLSDIRIDNGIKEIEINTIFGASEIFIDPQTPVLITADSAFAACSLPDGNDVNFGKLTYTSPNFEGDKNYLKIKASVIFGEMVFVNRK